VRDTGVQKFDPKKAEKRTCGYSLGREGKEKDSQKEQESTKREKSELHKATDPGGDGQWNHRAQNKEKNLQNSQIKRGGKKTKRRERKII